MPPSFRPHVMPYYGLAKNFFFFRQFRHPLQYPICFFGHGGIIKSPLLIGGFGRGHSSASADPICLVNICAFSPLLRRLGFPRACAPHCWWWSRERRISRMKKMAPAKGRQDPFGQRANLRPNWVCSLSHFLSAHSKGAAITSCLLTTNRVHHHYPLPPHPRKYRHTKKKMAHMYRVGDRERPNLAKIAKSPTNRKQYVSIELAVLNNIFPHNGANVWVVWPMPISNRIAG